MFRNLCELCVCCQQIMYWETFDGSQIRELEGSQQGSIDGMDISTDGSQFVTGADDKEVLVRQVSCHIYFLASFGC